MNALLTDHIRNLDSVPLNRETRNLCFMLLKAYFEKTEVVERSEPLSLRDVFTQTPERKP